MQVDRKLMALLNLAHKPIRKLELALTSISNCSPLYRLWNWPA